MMYHQRAEGWRFLMGFGLGLLASGGTVILILALLSVPLAGVPSSWRYALLVAVVAMFGVADLVNRTPHVWRQVPQRLVRKLAPGQLGFVWAYDLGLFVTTQKTTSLIWIALAGAVLTQQPPAIAVTVAAALVMFGAGVLVATIHRGGGALTDPALSLHIGRRWIRPAKLAAGVVGVGLAGYQAMGLLS
ncbi:hypothetical protein ABZ570_26755 [Micromonospora sp. NPDC007271]|uniref:hypothetical protein n=1 Tax=Micromonospora sp. NPDC007271 TaxID=3154587 RepID=UPI0033EDB33E